MTTIDPEETQQAGATEPEQAEVAAAAAPGPPQGGSSSLDALSMLPPKETMNFPPLVNQQLKNFDDNQRATFVHMYNSQKRSLGGMEALAILFPIQLFFLANIGVALAFLFTGGGFGIWWVVEWFLTPGRVRKYNAKVALDIVMQMKMLS